MLFFFFLLSLHIWKHEWGSVGEGNICSLDPFLFLFIFSFFKFFIINCRVLRSYPHFTPLFYIHCLLQCRVTFSSIYQAIRSDQKRGCVHFAFGWTSSILMDTYRMCIPIFSVFAIFITVIYYILKSEHGPTFTFLSCFSSYV